VPPPSVCKTQGGRRAVVNTNLQMAVCSKFHYPVQGLDPKEGGWFKGDYHCWCVHKATGHIVDPKFPEHNFLCAHNKLDISKPVYYPWKNQGSELGNVMKNIVREGILGDIIRDPDNLLPAYRRCIQNAINFKFQDAQSQRDYDIVIGSMGWKNKSGKGQWLEWG